MVFGHSHSCMLTFFTYGSSLCTRDIILPRYVGDTFAQLLHGSPLFMECVCLWYCVISKEVDLPMFSFMILTLAAFAFGIWGNL